MAEESADEESDDEKARREKKQKGKDNSDQDAVFDVSLANGAFVGAGPRSDNGTRASEFSTGDGALPVGLEFTWPSFSLDLSDA